MSAIRFDPAIDLDVLDAMADELESYLASEVLYWQMNPARPGNHAWPKLTVGGGLERLCRLRAYERHLTPDQRARLERVQQRLATLRDAHRARYVSKATDELRSRLDAWEWFLNDYAGRPGELAAYYPIEVRDRLKIALLVEALRGEPGLDDQVQRLRALDERLRADLVPGAFVWGGMLADAFPAESYWWLWGQLKESREELA